MTSPETSDLAKGAPTRLDQKQPDAVVSLMTKALRPGKVLIDWSQNNPSKTTVAAYSLRARPEPTASTPVTWNEVTACKLATDLVFTADDVLARVADAGDLFTATLSAVTVWLVKLPAECPGVVAPPVTSNRSGLPVAGALRRRYSRSPAECLSHSTNLGCRPWAPSPQRCDSPQYEC